MPLSIDPKDLIRWNDLSAQHWRDFALANPAILAIPCDIGRAQSVAQFLQHIVAAELRYAQRLAALPESDYAEIPYDTPDAIFSTHARALEIIRPLLADDSYDWAHEIEFQTISAGKIRASRKAILIHLLMHSVRHYAQLATLVRTHGFNPPWPGDYLFVDARRV